MNFFGFTSRKSIDEAASRLARQFSESCPPTPERGRDLEKRMAGALNDLYEGARQFRSECHLGVLNRARYAKAFQDELTRLGYPPDVVTKVTTALVINALSAD